MRELSLESAARRIRKLLVRESPAGKNVDMEVENIVEIHHQATTGEDTQQIEKT
jgi:hypothetical protein